MFNFSISKYLFIASKFFGSYLILLLIFQFLGIKEIKVKTLCSISNSLISNLLPDTKIYFQPSNNTPLVIQIERLSKTLEPVAPEKLYDSRVSFLNKKAVREQIVQAKNSENKSIIIKTYKYKFSIWHILLIPFLFVISFFVCLPKEWRPSYSKMGIILLLILVFSIFRFLASILYLADQTQGLETAHLFSGATFIITVMDHVQTVEFAFISTLLICFPFVSQFSNRKANLENQKK